jgi:hypothetical protein
MPLFQDRLRRILALLATLKGRSSTPPRKGLTHVAEAMDALTHAIQNIEERLQALEKARRPKGRTHA